VHLSDSWWYRLLRVAWFVIYGLALFGLWNVVYERYHPHKLADEQRSLGIVCDDGRTFLPPRQQAPQSTGHNTYIATAPNGDKVRFVWVHDRPPDEADIEERFAAKRNLCGDGQASSGSWKLVASFMAAGWLAIHLALTVLRGTVLYVVLGRFAPAPGLRGWLML